MKYIGALITLHLCVHACLFVSVHGRRNNEKELTLAELCLRNPLPDDTAGIVHHGGGLKLHGLHHVPHTDL